MDYTVIGGTVNAAARLEACAVPGSILVSYETYAHVKNHVRCEAAGEVTVKGVAYPIATYRVIDLMQEGDGPAPLRVSLPHLDLSADVTQMTDEERETAEHALKEALARLSHAASVQEDA